MPFDANGKYTPPGGWRKSSKKQPEIDLEELNRQIQVEQAPAPVQPPAPSQYQIPGAPMMHSPFDIVNALDKYKLPDLMGQPMQQPQSIMQQPQPKIESNWQPTTVGQPPPDAIGPYQDNRNFMQKSGDWLKSVFSPQGQIHKQIQAGAYEFGEGLAGPIPDLLMGKDASQQAREAIHQENLQQISPEVAKGLNIAGTATGAVAGGEALAPFRALQGINALNRVKTVPGALKATQTLGRTGADRLITTAGNTALTGMGAEVIQGMTTPDLQNRNTLEQMGAGLAAGSGDMNYGIGAGLDWLSHKDNGIGNYARQMGFQNLADDMMKTGEATQKGFNENYDFGWKSLINPNYYVYNVSKMLPFTAATLPLGFGGAAVVDSLIAETGMSAFGKNVLRSIGAGTATAPFEAATEAGQVYEDMRKKGLSAEEADKAANKTFWGNVGLLSLTNAGEFATAFMPKGLARGFDNPGVRLGMGAVTEGGQEMGQEAVSRYAKGEPIRMDANMLEQGLLGGIMGMGFGALGSIGNHEDTIHSIQNRTLDKLDQETKVDLQAAIEDARAQGISEEEAMSQVMDALADSPDAKHQQAIHDATQEEFQSKAIDKLNSDPAFVDNIVEQLSAQQPVDQAATTPEPVPAAPTPDMPAPVQQTQPMQPAPAPMPQDTALAPTNAPVTGQAAPAAINRGAQPGDTVTLRGKGDQKFTVVGHGAKDMLKLRSEKGGELTIHKKAVSGIISDGAAPAASERNAQTIKDEYAQLGKQLDSMVRARADELKAQNDASGSKSAGEFYEEALQEFHAGSNPEFTQLYEQHDNLLGELDTAKATEAKAAREAAGATPAANRPEPVTEQKKGEGGYKAGDRVKVNGENVTIRDVNPDGSYKGNYFNGSSLITMQFKADQVQEHTYSAPELKVGDTISFDDPFAKLTTKGGVLQPKPKMQAKIIRFSGDNAIVELTTKNGKPFGHPVGFYSLEVVPDEEAPANEDKPKNQSVPREAHEFNQADFLDPEKSGHRAVKKQGRGEWEMSYPDGRSWNKSIFDKHKDEKAAAKHFHTRAVLDAIRSGKTVSAGVLKDYPDLKKLYEIQQRFVKTISIDYDTVYVKSGEWDKSFKLYDYPETGNSYAQNKFVLEYIPTEFLNAKTATSGNSNIDALYVEQSLDAAFRRKIDEFQQDAMINLVGSSFSKTEIEDMAAIFRVAEQYVHDVKKAEYADMLDALDQAVRGEFDKVKTPMFQNLDKLWQAGSVHIKNEEALKMPGIHRFVGLVRYAEVAKALLGGRFDQAAASGEMTAVNISAAFQWTPFDFPERFRKLEEEQRKKKIAEIQARDLAEAKAMSESDAKDYVAKKAAESVTEWVMSGDLARAKKHLKDVYRNSGYSGGPVAFGIGGPRKGGIRLADGREFNMTEADYVNRTIDWARRLAGQSNDGFATQHDEALLNLVHSAGHDDSITQAIDKGNMKKARKEFDHVLDTYALDGDNSLDSADRDHLFQRFVELHKSGKLAELQAKGEWQQVHKKGMADKVAPAAASEEPAADQVVQSIDAAKQELPAKQFKMLAFAISNRPSEIEAVRRATPETILLSYGVWGGRADVGKVIEQIGYKPTIIMDSGAFTRYDAETGVGDTGGILDIMDAQADNYGDDISGFAEQLTWEAENLSGEKEGVTELHKFVKWYLDNKDHVNYVFNFDNLQDGSNQDPFAENATYGDRSMYAFRLLRAMDIPVIPVFHYGADPKVLEWYVDQGADYIALGKTAKGIGENERAEWARAIVEQYPDVKFHLLGTNNQRLIDKIPGLHSADGARWVFAAIDKGGDRVDAMTKEMQEREKKALGKVSEDELNRQIVDMRKRDFLQDREQLSQKTVDELQLIAKLNAYPHTGKKQEIIDRIIHFTRQLEKIGDMTREELEAMNAGDLRDLLRSVKERNNYRKSSLVNILLSLNETYKQRGDWQAKSYLHDNGFGPEQPKLTIKNITNPGDRVALFDPMTKEDLQTGELVRWIDDVTAEVKWDTGETETVSGFDLQKRRTDEQKAASATKGQEHANMSKWFADKNRDNWTPTHFYDGHPVETMDMPARDMIAYRYKEIRSELASDKWGGEIKKSDAVEMAKLKPLGQSDQTGEFKEGDRVTWTDDDGETLTGTVTPASWSNAQGRQVTVGVSVDIPNVPGNENMTEHIMYVAVNLLSPAAQTDQVDELQTEINNLAAEIESRIDGTVQEMQAGAGEMNVEDIRKRIMKRGGIAPYRDGHLKEEYKGIPLSLRNRKGLPLDQMADELGMSEHDLLLTLTGKQVKPNYEDLAKRKLQNDPEFTALQQTYDDLVQELDKLQGKAEPAANTEVKTPNRNEITIDRTGTGEESFTVKRGDWIARSVGNDQFKPAQVNNISHAKQEINGLSLRLIYPIQHVVSDNVRRGFRDWNEQTNWNGKWSMRSFWTNKRGSSFYVTMVDSNSQNKAERYWKHASLFVNNDGKNVELHDSGLTLGTKDLIEIGSPDQFLELPQTTEQPEITPEPENVEQVDPNELVGQEVDVLMDLQHVLDAIPQDDGMRSFFENKAKNLDVARVLQEQDGQFVVPAYVDSETLIPVTHIEGKTFETVGQANTAAQQERSVKNIQENVNADYFDSYYHATARINGGIVTVEETLSNSTTEFTFAAEDYPRSSDRWTFLDQLAKENGTEISAGIAGAIDKVMQRYFKDHPIDTNEVQPKETPAAQPKQESTAQPKQAKEETPNESTQSVGQDGGTPLEGVPAENVPGAAPVRKTGGSRVSSPSEDGEGNEQTDAAGNDSAGSVGTSQGEVDTASGRGNDAEPVTHPSNPKGDNYSIPEDADLGLKGKVTSYRDNVAAIRLMKEIMAEGRPATPEEKETLVKYVGWGGIAEPFSPDWQVPQDWKTQNAELKELLTPEEFNLAADTILNAHYTSLDVIRAIYNGLSHLGFESGRVLEPSMGIGHFLGVMPQSLAKQARITGIEIDAITGNIGKLLYPNADIRIQGFQETKIADNFYDVAIGNVPFGNIGIYDPEYEKKGLTKSIHNYFFAKSIDKVRPGGVVMFLTSRFTMDGEDQKIRAYLASKADLIGAVRLPNTAFKKNAGTEVVTDLIILQKREEGTAAADTSWLGTQPMDVEERTFEVNTYYHEHPEMVMGDFSTTGRMYRGGELTVTPDRDRAKLQEQIANAIKTYLPANIITKRVHKATEAPDKRDLLPAPGYVKENAYHFVDGKLHIKEEGLSVPVDVPKATLDRIKGLINIRDALRDYFQHQMYDAAENVIQGSRKRLNAVYDGFVKANGPINATANVRAYQTDPDFYLLTALEKYDAKTKTAKKADVFSKRTIEPYKPVEKTDNAKDALTVSQQESGMVNMDRMMQLTGMSEEGIAEELKGIIYRDPILGWVSTDEYLSGNVRAKLAEAENAAKLDPIYQENVDALNEVQPVDLTEKDISVRLGAGWVPTRYIQEFASHILGLRSDAIRVGYNEHVAEWTIEIPDDGHRRRAKTGTDATVKWGTRDVNALDLLVKALNYRNVQVWAKDGNGKRYTVQKATVAAREKLESIKTEYVKWIWSDEARKNYLLDYYNRTYNTERLREYDGSHLQFPGMNPGITLKAHQKAAVWRAIQNPNTLFAHAVGAGKTFEMIASMMELKRMGLIKKPMWTVPNHLVEQMGQDFMKLYPSANILVATKKDFESKKRQSLMARIATGEFDAVIVAHSSFAFIPLSMERSQAFFDAQLEQLELAIQQEVQSGKRKDSGIAKAVRKARKSLETRMRKQLGRLKKDQAVSFEEMGVDAIVVDEAHEFKNLFYFTKNSRVGGLGDPEGSSKAFDLLMKAQYIQAMNGRTIFATGTPVANSMAEMFTMMRYLSPDELQSRGISHFDAWASLFGELGKELELAPEGKGYRIKEKFKNFANVAELKRLFRKFADVQMADELLAKGLIKRPELKGGKREVVIVSASAELTKYVDELGERANAVRENRVKPDVDNMLKIVSDGRKAALDMRLVDPSLRENPISKLNHAADNLFRIYKETTGVYAEYTNDEGQPVKVSKGAQLVFLDLSTPKGEKTDKEGNVIQDDGEEEQQNISIYDELRKKLIKKGVPPKEIAFIHDYKTDAKKLELYGMVNEGKIRFLLGSTFKMGAGMNVQERLVALHHLDVPWRPSDIEQREGRILRQGNLNPEVQIFTYNTEGSFDAYMWQVIANKAAMIETGMNNDMSIRTMQDFSDSTLSAREAMALASGDVRVMELENLRVEVDTLEVKLQNAIETEWNIKRRLQWQPNKRSKEKSLYDAYKATLDSIEPATGDHFKVVVDGKTYTKRIDGGDALLAKVELLKEKGKDGITKVGTFGSLPIVLERKTSEDVLFPDVDVTGYLEGKKGVKAYFSVSDSNLGQVRSLEIALERIEPRVKEIADELAHIDEETGKLNEQLDAAAAERSEMEQTLSEKRMRRDALAEELNMDKPEDQVLDGLDDNASDDSEDDGDSGDGSQGRSYAMASGSAATSGGTKQRKPRKTPINRAIEETKIKLTPKATAKLADLLADTLDVVVGEDFVRQRAEGTFTPSSGATRVRGRSYYDWRVVGHELGHAFSHKFGRPGDEKELKQMIQLYPRQGRGIPAADKPEEGFAEFFRQWAADPVLARKNAPQTAKLFEQFIEGNPDLNEIFAKIRTIVDADLADTALGRAVAGVISSEITDDGTLYGEDQYRVSGAAKFTFEAMDFTIPAKAMMRAARKRGANLKIELDKLLAVVGDAKAKALSNFKGQAKDHQGRFIGGRPLLDIMQEGVNVIGDATGWTTIKLKTLEKESPIYKQYRKMGAMDIFSAITISLRIMERSDKGFDKLPMPPEMAEEILQIAEDRYPEALKLATEYTATLSNMILTKLERVGILTPKTRKTIERGSQFYIPFIYDEKAAARMNGRSGGGRTNKNPVKRFKGKVAPILDVFQASMLKLAEVEQAIEYKRVIESIHDIAAAEGMGAFAQFVPAPKTAVNISTEQIAEKIEKILGDDVDLTDILDEANMTFFMNGGLEKVDPNKPVIMNIRNGRPRFIELAPDVYRMLMSMKPVQIEGIARGLAWLSKIARHTALVTPRYIANAVARDAGISLVQSKAPVHSLVKHSIQASSAIMGLGEQGDAIYQDFVNSGGFSGSAHGMILNQLTRQHDTSIIETKAPDWYRLSLKGGKKVLSLVWNGGPNVIRFFEEGPRIAVYIATWKREVGKIEDENGDLYDADKLWNDYLQGGTDALPEDVQEEMERILLEGSYNSREITTNFGLHGVHEAVRKYVPTTAFLHGTIQGTYRTVRNVRENKGKIALITGIGFTLISVISWALMNGDPEREKDYQDMDSSARDKYWWFPTLQKGVYFAIAKPFDYAIPMNMVERFMDHAWSKYPNARKTMADLGSLFSTVTNTQVMNTVVNTMWGMSKNETSLGGKIVPDSDRNKAKDLQYSTTTSLTARKLAEFAADLTGDPTKGVSPRMIDYFIKQNFGRWGAAGLKTTDSLGTLLSTGELPPGGPSGIEYAPLVGQLFYGQAEGSSRIVEKFYKDYNKAQTLSGSVKQLMKDKVKEAPSWATEDNIKLLKSLPSMSSISDGLSASRKEYDADIKNATTPELKRQLTLQKDFVEKLAAGLMYGVEPAAPEDAGLDEKKIRSIRTRFKYDAATSTTNERNRSGGASEEAAYLAKLLKNK